MSSTDIQVHTQFTDERIALIKRTIAPTVTNDEFSLFIDRCRQTGLDPVARQIYALSRYDRQVNGNKMSIQVSIDGMRLLAERSGKYAGQLGPFWCDESGEWRDVWLGSKPPVAARVGIIRGDFREPLYAVAKYSSYVQTNKDGSPSLMWSKMPDVLLAKCAESLAIRRAFPHETSGLYTREEMMQAEVVESEIVASATESVNEQQSTYLRKVPASYQDSASKAAVAQQENNKPLTLVERRRAVYDRALELGQFQKGATREESGKAFLAFVGPIVGATVANIEQLTASRLDAIEAYLNAKDVA